MIFFAKKNVLHDEEKCVSFTVQFDKKNFTSETHVTVNSVK